MERSPASVMSPVAAGACAWGVYTVTWLIPAIGSHDPQTPIAFVFAPACGAFFGLGIGMVVSGLCSQPRDEDGPQVRSNGRSKAIVGAIMALMAVWTMVGALLEDLQANRENDRRIRQGTGSSQRPA